MDLTENAEPRIYVVVAETVQTPLLSTASDSLLRGFTTVFAPTPETRHIVQPAGRMAAQAAHAVSKVRVEMVRQKMRAILQTRKFKSDMLLRETRFEPITTIVLAARDSFELGHVLNLLFQARISVEEFGDINPEAYGGPGSVRTAIATWPMQPREVVGILDYLPLALREG